jgi:AraC-like DNA-binding protein
MPGPIESAAAGYPSVRYSRPARLGGVELLEVSRAPGPWRFVDDAHVVVYLGEGEGIWTCRGTSAPLAAPCVLVAGPWDALILDHVRQPLAFRACWIQASRMSAAAAARGFVPGTGAPAIERREPGVLAAFEALGAGAGERAGALPGDDDLGRALGTLLEQVPVPLARPAPAAEAARRRIHDEYDASPFGKSVAVPSLAAGLRLGTVPFIREFKRAFGLPPYQYFVHVRLARARSLIQAGPAADRLTFADIATDSGYFDLAQMGKAFREILRVGPRDYARQIDVYDRWLMRRSAVPPRGRGPR